MGYTTTFKGYIEVEPPLNKDEINYLTKFSKTRRMKRTNGPYFVNGTGIAGQNCDPDVIDNNNPPEGQPGLWCQWIPNNEGTKITWNGAEKFYDSEAWLEYLIEHFIGENPIAKKIALNDFNFLQAHVLNGEIKAQGEDPDDCWTLYVIENIVCRVNKH